MPLTTLRHVFITHQHSDHNADYGNLLLLAWESGLQHRSHRIPAVILDGTELPLLLDAQSRAAVPLLDTTAIHVDEVIRRMT